MHESHFYHHFPPNSEVTDRLDDIKRQNDLILKGQDYQMSQADDLNNLVTSLATGYGALHTAEQVEINALLGAFATIPQPDPAPAAAITQAISNLTALSGKMATDAAALTAMVPAATTVPPPTVATPATPPTVTPPALATPPVTDPAATPPSTPPASATTT